MTGDSRSQPKGRDVRQHLPPLPWSYETNAPADQHEGKGFVYLIDANGRKIGTVWGKPDEKMATMQFIMDAVDAAIHGLARAQTERGK